VQTGHRLGHQALVHGKKRHQTHRDEREYTPENSQDRACGPTPVGPAPSADCAAGRRSS
jgi:hypothetical protein